MDFQTHKTATESLTTFTNNDEQRSVFNNPITITELRAALCNINNPSPGPDDIPSIFIKNLPESAIEQLLKIYNITQVFPDIWMNSLIIPLYKSGKQKLEPSSYRPISLTCCMCKLLEKIVNKRLIWLLEQRNLISHRQSGFRPNRRTLDNLTLLQTEILDSLVNKQETIAVFFDIQSAFEKIWRLKVLEKLQL